MRMTGGFVDAINFSGRSEPWRELLYANLRNTIEESSTFLLGDYEEILIFYPTSDLPRLQVHFLPKVFYYITQINSRSELMLERLS